MFEEDFEPLHSSFGKGSVDCGQVGVEKTPVQVALVRDDLAVLLSRLAVFVS
jgi:hypothetical protein